MSFRAKLPAELLNNISALIDKPTLDFLRVPTYRDGGNFTVTGPGTK
ncbi:MAG: hypothetical protein GXO74_04265 [Calditrichaeota bacterium]|nr:hypothetical protein [Calditrichota bacterium]